MKKITVIILLFCIMFLTACKNTSTSSNKTPSNNTLSTLSNNTSSNAVYRKMSAEDAYKIMQDSNNYILLDVRTTEEFKERHIKGAVLIPDYEIESRVAAELPNKNALILIYCRSGRRSANVANKLVEMEYTNVYDFGGINDWSYDTVVE